MITDFVHVQRVCGVHMIHDRTENRPFQSLGQTLIRSFVSFVG